MTFYRGSFSTKWWVQNYKKRIVLYNSMLNVGLPLHWLNLRSALKLIIFLRCNIKRNNNMRKYGITTLELSLDHPLGSSNKIKIWNAGFHGWRKNYEQGQDPTTNSIFVWCQVWESSLYHSRGGRWALSPQYLFAWSQTTGTSHILITVKLSNVKYEINIGWLAVSLLSAQHFTGKQLIDNCYHTK